MRSSSSANRSSRTVQKSSKAVIDTRSSCTSMQRRSSPTNRARVRSKKARRSRSRRRGGSVATQPRSRSPRTRTVSRSMWVARREPFRRHCAGRSSRGTGGASTPAATTHGTWTGTTSSTGPRVARPRSRTSSRSAASITVRCTKGSRPENAGRGAKLGRGVTTRVSRMATLQASGHNHRGRLPHGPAFSAAA